MKKTTKILAVVLAAMMLLIPLSTTVFAMDMANIIGIDLDAILGALGGQRNDHSVANIQLLHYITSKGARGTIYHGDEIFTAFSDGTLKLSAENEGYVSVFSLTNESRGVTIRNLKYTLEDATLYSYIPIGVSNEFLGNESCISVEEGTLLVVYKK